MTFAPSDIGSFDAFPGTLAVLRQGLESGLQIGAQLAVVRAGQVLCDAAIGWARPETSDAVAVPMSAETLMLWLSSSKPVAAVAIMQLLEQDRLTLDDSVARYVPEFGANGKEGVTIRHLLTHVGGFRFIDIGDAATPWDEIIRRLCIAPLERNWVPGERAGYHPYTSWYVLGEIVRRVSGLSYSEYVRERIFLPLGMTDCWIGMPENVRASYGDRLGVMANTETKGDLPPSLALHSWSTPSGVTACVPGANGHAPAHQFVRLYEMLLGGGTREGVTILQPESVALMSARSRVGMFDETFRHTLDWGLGVIPNNRRYGLDTVPYGYGRHAGDGAFGHSGSQSSAAFCDPENRLAVAVVLNGTCGERRHQPRMRAVLEAIYEDLGITRDD
ncbi:MAG: serine hydrolase domain-containing protein [Pirellulales bacterium]